MFAYCNNNPINLIDSTGTLSRKPFLPYCIDPEGNSFESTLGEYIDRIARPVERTLDDLLAHTHSTGVVLGGNTGGLTMGKSLCVSNDNSGNFALQESTSLGGSTSFGFGLSGGFAHTITNAHNVQDLSGMSTAWGVTICLGNGISVDVISFEPSPGVRKWGLTVAYVWGAEFEVHASETNTVSTNSWQLWRLYT